LRSERFLYLNRIFDLDFDPENAGKIYLEYLSLEGHLNEDALYVCKKLHLLNIKIGIITNGAEVVQRPRLLQSSLNNYIDFLITSEEAGLPKPHAKIFEMCLERAKINEKKHICIVGDSLNSDIKGGNLFGITTCWYNPFRVRPEFTEDTTPHFIINNLKEILGRI